MSVAAADSVDLVSFDYGVLPIKNLQVNTVIDKKKGKRIVDSVSVDGEKLKPSDRFWNSLFARYGFNNAFFNFYEHAEVFARISERMSNDRMRVCIERKSNEDMGRLLAVSNPAKPVVDYKGLCDLVARYGGERVTYHNGIVESVHVPRATAGYQFNIGGDAYQNRFVLSSPIDGYGQPNTFLSLLRMICSNGAVGYTRAFRSEIALGKNDDNIIPQLVRTLDGFNSDEGFAAMRQRFEVSQMSWASVYEAMKLQSTLYKLYSSRDVDDADKQIPANTRLGEYAYQSRSSRIGTEADAVLQAPVFRALDSMTGNPSRTYGVANLDALSVKRQRALPVKCTMYDMIQFVTEVATHYSNANAARKLQAWVGETISNEYDMENTKHTYTEFADFQIDAKLSGGLTGSKHAGLN